MPLCPCRKSRKNLAGSDLETVTVGSANSGPKSVAVPPNTWCPPTCDKSCRLNTDYQGYPDNFNLSVNPATNQLTATRTDTGNTSNGWGMNLQVPCFPSTPIVVGPGTGAPKTVSVPPGTWCPATCGAGCLKNTDYLGYPDKFNVKVTPAGQLTITRTDAPGVGWSMNATIPCFVPDPEKLVTVGPATGGTTKSVQVPAGTWCPPTCGQGCYAVDPNFANGVPDTYNLTVQGTTLTAQRTDNGTPGFGAGWGLNLKVPCLSPTA